ncbi:MAG TPA: FtsX-like permease family protein [Gaiellaceae bacterium]|nr:FtsX-like permease family protein [Gaiellaceae bacterium]
MTELFGIPMDTLLVVLLVLLGAVVGAVAVLALRNRVLLRLGVRNVSRRRGRSALIVVGLMLGTAIIAAALATGDTMAKTIRTSAVTALGQTDVIVSVRGAEVEVGLAEAEPTGVQYFPMSHYREIERALEGSPLVDGVAPAIVEPVAVADIRSRQQEPRISLFATDPEAMDGFGSIVATDGTTVSLADLRPGEVFLDSAAADELAAEAGDPVRVLAGGGAVEARVRAVVDYDGAFSDTGAVLMALEPAQELLGRQALVKRVLVSNRGDATTGAALTDDVIRELQPTLSSLGLAASPVKQDVLELADAAGASFMSLFTTFGSFSIAAGILLIFLIFVMLAAERRGELGIARAIGTRRGHLVQMFVYEGVAYDLLAAVVGVGLGIAVAYGMVIAMAAGFEADMQLDITYSVQLRSILIAYAIGVLLTFVVVAVSASRVSRMNISTAIRNLPEPPAQKGRRRRWAFVVVGLVAGGLLVVSGVSSKQEVVLGVGVSLLILSLVPVARAVGVPDRVAKTVAGLALVVWFVTPLPSLLVDDLKSDFSIFLVGGLAIVLGATWAIMYNADILLGAASRVLGRVGGLAPVLKMAMAYPLRSLFRTGVTLVMFTLVVFTLVVGATVSGSFVGAFDDVESFSGGFDIRATSSPVSPILDMQRELEEAPGVDPADFTAVSSQSVLPVSAKQAGTDVGYEDYAARGLDRAYLETTTYGLAARAKGYGSSEEVWRAIRDRPGLAVVDSFVVPRREAFMFGVMPDFQLEGFYLEDETFDPVPVTIRDPQTGKAVQLTVIGVVSETAAEEMAYGIATSQETLAGTFGYRVDPTVHLFALRDGVDVEAAAQSLERAFVGNGLEADALPAVLADAVGASWTMNRIVQGFMGLGLIVGVAALGVITARSVVERRQQIGVARAIGFQRRMVQLSFLLESSFIALTAILVGTLLGLAVAWNIIADAASAPSYENLAFEVPWLNLGIIFAAVYLVALATTWAPALRASRVYPAEALRYQ